MKKLILATVIMSISTCALAKEPFRYGIGMCEYAYSGRSDSIMYSVKNAHRMPEDVYKQQDKYCSSEENIAKAEEQLKKWKALPESAGEHPQYQAQPKDDNYNRGLDLFNACIAGAELDTNAYSLIVNKYRGKKGVYLMQKAYDYGRLNARNERDCTNYVMGR
ncbi:MAG: hypothetical protein QRY16_19660 [Enterobacterales bacterium endosymbiont of Blomia tropicalis]|uniref:hypothetical protein n=1 Tax=Mixta mediterraneensis TaxID=2758443 RepID=UPI0025A73BEC|nr:hypothetical protein [Mixta mediterraneensis]MDL4915901.1 hypothetical protein [Mixta mediterraneensis]